MPKNQKSPDTNLPIWFDGKNINEALFCEEFLRKHKIIFTNGAFFHAGGSGDGRSLPPGRNL